VARYSIHTNPTANKFLDAVREVGTIEDPNRVLYTFGRRMWRIWDVDLFLGVSQRGLGPGEYKITRFVRPKELDPHADEPPHNPWKEWDDLPLHTGGIIGELIGDHTPRVLRDLDVPDDPVLGGALAGMRSGIVVPIYDTGEVLNWMIQFRAAADGYDDARLEQATLTANVFGTATKALLALREVRDLHRQLERQFEEVARVQQSLLPRRLPRIPHLKIATSYLTSDQAGGDYYDFFRFPEGHWGLLIADVSGHGAAAATVMAMLRGILHAYDGRCPRPDAVLRYVNDRLLTAELEGMFITAFLAIYDPETGELTYSRSGHNPPRLKKGSTGEVIALDGAPSVPLGIFADFEPESDTVALEPNDTLVLYTDGITEAFAPGEARPRDMFGTQGLDRALEHCSGEPECVVDSVHHALFEHTRSRDRDDDQTIVAVRYLPSATDA